MSFKPCLSAVLRFSHSFSELSGCCIIIVGFWRLAALLGAGVQSSRLPCACWTPDAAVSPRDRSGAVQTLSILIAFGRFNNGPMELQRSRTQRETRSRICFFSIFEFPLCAWSVGFSFDNKYNVARLHCIYNLCCGSLQSARLGSCWRAPGAEIRIPACLDML